MSEERPTDAQRETLAFILRKSLELANSFKDFTLIKIGKKRLKVVAQEIENAIMNASVSSYDYLNTMTKIILRLSPSFYTGRHSFMFRALIFSDDWKSIIPDNVDFWPEISDNTSLQDIDFEFIIDTSYAEGAVLFQDLTTIWRNVDEEFSEDKTLSEMKSLDIFGEEEEHARYAKGICFGDQSVCRVEEDNKISVPSSYSDSSFCGPYEAFLHQLAKYQLHSDILGSTVGVDSIFVEPEVGDAFRRAWRREISMMRRYLDFLGKD